MFMTHMCIIQITTCPYPYRLKMVTEMDCWQRGNGFDHRFGEEEVPPKSLLPRLNESCFSASETFSSRAISFWFVWPFTLWPVWPDRTIFMPPDSRYGLTFWQTFRNFFQSVSLLLSDLVKILEWLKGSTMPAILGQFFKLWAPFCHDI